MEQPMPDRMFHSQYPFYTSNSTFMQEHFRKFAETVKARKPNFVVEIGCNDGTLLRHFKGMPHLGFEPAVNVAEIATNRGCVVQNIFFDSLQAEAVVEVFGKADAIVAANVICHIADLPDLAEGVRTLLKDDGVFIFEEPYLPAMMERCSFDQIYDEHVFIFSCNSVMSAFSRHGLYLVDCKPQEAHGGSMRYTLSPYGGSPISVRLDAYLSNEDKLGLDKPKTYQTLKRHIEAKSNMLVSTIDAIKREGKRIVGYGATSKSTTVTNYCGLGSDQIEYISDTTPIKQGKFSPGMHIPVKSHNEFAANLPDVALLFAWNHREEIYEKEKDFKGQWLNYVPAVGLKK
jgi:methylation protein EvaC